MNLQWTEEIVRRRASDQSYEKGRSYFRSGAIYNCTPSSAHGDWSTGRAGPTGVWKL